jgi:Predicted redox protein, regulator of disulfide bond formation
MEAGRPAVLLTQEEGFCFSLRFGDEVVWTGDESPPLGAGRGPTPAQLLAAAVANCMVDALYFALHKFNPDSQGKLAAEGWTEIGRNTIGRLRVLGLRVVLKLPYEAREYRHLERILMQFEEFCTVGRSVAQGIPLQVQVMDAIGQVLKES